MLTFSLSQELHGRPWKAGSKTKDQLLMDYEAVLMQQEDSKCGAAGPPLQNQAIASSSTIMNHEAVVLMRSYPGEQVCSLYWPSHIMQACSGPPYVTW
jgi:hypothetical protein